MVKRFSKIIEDVEKDLQKRMEEKRDAFSNLLKALPQNNREPIRKLYSVVTLAQINKFLDLSKNGWYYYSNRPSPKSKPDLILVLKNTDEDVLLLFPDGTTENLEFTKQENNKYDNE